jgi:hypothetical protein
MQLVPLRHGGLQQEVPRRVVHGGGVEAGLSVQVESQLTLELESVWF